MLNLTFIYFILQYIAIKKWSELMKELNVVSSNVSLVFDGNKIQVSKPTENQDKILECENSIEIIKNNIEKKRKGNKRKSKSND